MNEMKKMFIIYPSYKKNLYDKFIIINPIIFKKKLFKHMNAINPIIFKKNYLNI